MKVSILVPYLKICLAVAALSSLALSARAYEDEYRPRPVKPLTPANRYQGRTPDDLSNGLLFDNGTYGLRDMNYESWATAPSIIPGVSTLDYPYSDKEELVGQLNEFAQFVEDAITNWKTTSSITKPEAKTYGDESAATMQPLLDKFKETVKRASGSNQSDWMKNQADAATNSPV